MSQLLTDSHMRTEKQRSRIKRKKKTIFFVYKKRTREATKGWEVTELPEEHLETPVPQGSCPELDLLSTAEILQENELEEICDEERRRLQDTQPSANITYTLTNSSEEIQCSSSSAEPKITQDRNTDDDIRSASKLLPPSQLHLQLTFACTSHYDDVALPLENGLQDSDIIWDSHPHQPGTWDSHHAINDSRVAELAIGSGNTHTSSQPESFASEELFPCGQAAFRQRFQVPLKSGHDIIDLVNAAVQTDPSPRNLISHA